MGNTEIVIRFDPQTGNMNLVCPIDTLSKRIWTLGCLAVAAFSILTWRPQENPGILLAQARLPGQPQ